MKEIIKKCTLNKKLQFSQSNLMLFYEKLIIRIYKDINKAIYAVLKKNND